MREQKYLVLYVALTQVAPCCASPAKRLDVDFFKYIYAADSNTVGIITILHWCLHFVGSCLIEMMQTVESQFFKCRIILGIRLLIVQGTRGHFRANVTLLMFAMAELYNFGTMY